MARRYRKWGVMEPDMSVLGDLVEDRAEWVIEALELLSSHVNREGDRLANSGGTPPEEYRALWWRSSHIYDYAQEIRKLCDEAAEARS